MYPYIRWQDDRWAQVLWDLIREQGADEDGDNRISEEEFVRQNGAVGVESAALTCFNPVPW